MKKRGLLIVLTVLLTLMCAAVPTYAASGLSDDPYVSIISPGDNEVLTSGNVLVSLKITVPRTVKVDFYEVNNDAGNTKTLISSSKYTSTKSLSYYTKQFTDLEKGVYCLDVSTLNASGKAIYATEVYMKVQKKTSSSFQIDVFNSKGTTSSFWSGLLSKLFS